MMPPVPVQVHRRHVEEAWWATGGMMHVEGSGLRPFHVEGPTVAPAGRPGSLRIDGRGCRPLHGPAGRCRAVAGLPG